MSEEVMGVLLQHIARLEQQIEAVRQEHLYSPPVYADMSMPEAHAPFRSRSG